VTRTEKGMTSPDLDLGDCSAPSMGVATGADSKINVLPYDQDMIIRYYNRSRGRGRRNSAVPKAARFR
jgi:hypothetical protein